MTPPATAELFDDDEIIELSPEEIEEIDQALASTSWVDGWELLARIQAI